MILSDLKIANRVEKPACRTEILHIAPGQWAGHMRIYHRECQSLIRAGYKVELLAHPMLQENYSPLVKIESLGKLPESEYRLFLWSRFIRNLLAFCKALKSNASLFHYHSPEFIPWAIMLSFLKPQPIIFDCMEDFENYISQRLDIPLLMRVILSRLMKLMLRWAANKSDAVITSDKGMADYFQKDTKRIIVIHNFPAIELFPDPKDFNISKKYDLVFHGALERYINICLDIDDALIRRGCFLRWYFVGVMPHLNEFLKALEMRSKQDRFFIKSRVPHNLVYREIIKAKIGIIPLPDLPKYHKNIPQKMFEYMALRLPIVMSNLPPSAPFIKNYESAMLVAPGDVNQYADVIVQLLTDIKLASKLSQNGRMLFENLYNWEKESIKLVNLYFDLLKRNPI